MFKTLVEKLLLLWDLEKSELLQEKFLKMDLAAESLDLNEVLRKPQTMRKVELMRLLV